MSKDFTDLVKGIGETRSKDEEQEIMRREVTKLRVACQKPEYTALHVRRNDKSSNNILMSSADDNARRQCELLIRLIYCEMLGFEVPFGYMAALNCTQHSRPDVQRAGYLALTLFLNGEHELTLLATNSLMKSLSSPDVREVCSALTAVCKLVTARTVPVFFETVKKLATKHDRALVRKKAVMALHSMVLTRPAPEAITGWESTLRETLCDKDPCVMSATLSAIYDILVKERTRINSAKAKSNSSTTSATAALSGSADNSGNNANFTASRWVDIIQPLGSILTQIISRKLPRACDYNGMPAPWVQVRIIDLFGILGEGNASASAKMYEPLGAALRAALGFRLSVSSMVIYSVVKTATRIVPDKALLGLAAAQIGSFLRSGQPNLRYLGIRAMAAALNSSEESGEDGFAAVFASKPQFQMAVVECLESNDDTLRHETLDILYHMTNAANVQAITTRMLDALRRDVGGVSSEHLRRELAAKIAQIVDRYAPSSQWALETLCAVLEAARDSCPESVPEALSHTLDPRVTQGIDTNYAKFAVDWFVAKVAESLAPGARRLPAGLARIASFVLGEYGHLAQCGAQTVVQHLLDLAEKFHDVPEVLGPLMSSLAKVCGRTKMVPENVLGLFEKMKSSSNIDLQQRAYEHSAVLANIASAYILVTGACRKIKPDPSLPFLSGFVSAAVAKGAKPYKNPKLAALDINIDGLSAVELLHVDDSAPSGPTTDLNVAAYPTPQKQQPAPMTDLRTTPYDVTESSTVPAALLSDPEVAAEATRPSISSIGATKKSKWTLSGYNANPNATPSPAPAAAAPAAAQSTGEFIDDGIFGVIPASSAAAAPAPAPAPAKPSRQQNAGGAAYKMSSEEQRKARIAKDLFGFSGGAAGARSAPKKPAQAPAAAAAAPHSASADLLGLDIGTPAPSAPISQQQQQQSSNNLLDILGGGSMGSAPAAAPSMGARASGNDLLDLGIPSSTTTTTTAPAMAAPLTGSGSMPFSAGAFSHPNVIHIGNIPNSAFMSRDVLPYIPNANINATLVSSSGAVGLYSIPLLFKDGYGLAIIVNNDSDGELSYANTVQVQVPTAAPITCDISATAQGVKKQGQGKVVLEKIPAKCSPVCVCRLDMRQVGVQQVVKVMISINSGSGNVDVGMKDFLREIKMSTKEVGSVWQKHNQEKKVAIKASDIRSAVSKVVSTLHAHCAEIINDEAILVVQVASKMQPLCLIHCRFSKASQQATVAIRSESPFLTDSVARALI